jgi:hypothetical protein
MPSPLKSPAASAKPKSSLDSTVAGNPVSPCRISKPTNGTSPDPPWATVTAPGARESPVPMSPLRRRRAQLLEAALYGARDDRQQLLGREPGGRPLEIFPGLQQRMGHRLQRRRHACHRDSKPGLGGRGRGHRFGTLPVTCPTPRRASAPPAGGRDRRAPAPCGGPPPPGRGPDPDTRGRARYGSRPAPPAPGAARSR